MAISRSRVAWATYILLLRIGKGRKNWSEQCNCMKLAVENACIRKFSP